VQNVFLQPAAEVQRQWMWIEIEPVLRNWQRSWPGFKSLGQERAALS